MGLFPRIALTAAAIFLVAAFLGLAVLKPASRGAFVARSDRLLRDTEGAFSEIAASLVDEAIGFSAASALAADEQRARDIADLPLVLYTDSQGALQPEVLREAVRSIVADPTSSLPEKHAAVRAEILDRTRRGMERRFGALRESQTAAAQAHGESEATRTVTAWGGLLLVLLAAGAFVLDRVVVRPVRAATRAQVRFGGGGRGFRLAEEGGAEMAELARAFNRSAESVERTEAENRELRTLLEEKVKERTAALVRAARASSAGTLAGGVAHEFNNLLGGILGCADAALAEGPAPAVREALAMIEKTARRGVGVTGALLRATRAEPERAACDLNGLLEEALAEVRPPASIEVRASVRPVPLHADGAMLRQVLVNLVRNAVEAMEGTGQLGLEVREEGDGVVVEISDTGPGIDPAVRDVLFEPFVTTRRGGREGAGLGLFLADRLVAAHGGRIEVAEGRERGTRFLIHLPSARRS